VTLTADEELELRALVDMAFAVRDLPIADQRPFLDVLIEWREGLVFRRVQRTLLHREARIARTIAVLRETDPQRLARTEAA